MYQKGEYVMHRSEGVCRIEDIRTEQFGPAKPQSYYILQPVYERSSTTVFLPTAAEEKRLRSLTSGEQLTQLLQNAADTPTVWIDNDRLRQEQFQQLLHQCDLSALLRLWYDLRTHRKALTAQGKKLRYTDEHSLQECERLLFQECAYALQIDLKEVSAYLRENGISE